MLLSCELLLIYALCLLLICSFGLVGCCLLLLFRVVVCCCMCVLLFVVCRLLHVGVVGAVVHCCLSCVVVCCLLCVVSCL